jgi:hypothetical protein
MSCYFTSLFPEEKNVNLLPSLPTGSCSLATAYGNGGSAGNRGRSNGEPRGNGRERQGRAGVTDRQIGRGRRGGAVRARRHVVARRGGGCRASARHVLAVLHLSAPSRGAPMPPPPPVPVACARIELPPRLQRASGTDAPNLQSHPAPLTPSLLSLSLTRSLSYPILSRSNKGEARRAVGEL